MTIAPERLLPVTMATSTFVALPPLPLIRDRGAGVDIRIVVAVVEVGDRGVEDSSSAWRRGQTWSRIALSLLLSNELSSSSVPMPFHR